MAGAPHEEQCYRLLSGKQQHVTTVGSELGHIALTTTTGRLVALLFVAWIVFMGISF
jgi:hypothetical protein